MSSSSSFTLLPYQQDDVSRCINQFKGRCFLSHEMGLGKSLISLAVANHFNGKKLVLCPSYLTLNWLNELIKFGFCSSANDRVSQVIKKTTDRIEFSSSFVIMSYDIAVRKINELQSLTFETIICDESHFLKNRDSKRFKTLESFLSRSSKQLLLLTGTPAPNKVKDLWSQLFLLDPIRFKNYYDFANRYCNGHKSYYGYDDTGSSNEGELNEMLTARYMIRRLKKDVLPDLPLKRRIIVPIEVKVTASMKKDKKKLAQLNKVINEEQCSKAHQELKYLISKMFHQLAPEKAIVLKTYFENTLAEIASTDKVILFAHHMNILDTIELVCQTLKIGYIRCDGSTSVEEKNGRITRFLDENSDVNIALLGLQACSTGLNLVPVSKMFFCEVTYNLDIIKQAEDRIHRIGAKGESLEYIYLIAENTIDENVMRNITWKHGIIDQVIDNGKQENEFDFE